MTGDQAANQWSAGPAQRSTLDLLAFDLVFTQHPVLTRDDLIGLMRDMGLGIDDGQLQSLYRMGILVPFFGVEQSAAALRRQGSHLDPEYAKLVQTIPEGRYKDVRLLQASNESSDVFDPALSDPRPWNQKSRFAGRKIERTAFLYSHWQIVAARQALQIGPARDLERQAKKKAGWAAIRDGQVQRGRTDRRLGILLSAIEAAYLPLIDDRIAGFMPEGWSSYRRGFEPEKVLDQLAWTAEEVADAAKRLLAEAGLFDPLSDWTDLVGLVSADKRRKLKGQPRLAVEFRVAAEILFKFYEDLVSRGCAPALEPVPDGWWHPRQDRLNAARNLDRILTRYGISPHPSLLVVVEGKTEREFVRAYLDHRYDSRWEIGICLLDAEGADNDVTAAAALMAPRIEGLKQGYFTKEGYLELERPLTRVLLIGDPEGHLRNEEARRSAKNKWVERIRRSLPDQFRDVVLDEDLEALISIEVSDSAFEYAHFDDDQIAASIEQTCKSPSVPEHSELVAQVRQARANKWNLKKIWTDWEPPAPNKVRMAKALFPDLIQRVDAYVPQSGDQEPDAARIIRTLIRMSQELPRDGSLVLRVKPQPAPGSAGAGGENEEAEQEAPDPN
jgi:hypothetical protein